MSGSPGLTLALAAILIVIAGTTYRRRGDGETHSPLLAWILGGLALVGAIILFFLYRRP